jgi:integrase
MSLNLLHRCAVEDEAIAHNRGDPRPMHCREGWWAIPRIKRNLGPDGRRLRAQLDRNPIEGAATGAIVAWLADSIDINSKNFNIRHTLERAPSPRFAAMHLDQIGPEDVDRYKATKLREGALGPNQINKSLGLLAMILDAAGDYGHIDAARNPARGRWRRVKRSTPNRPTVEPEQLPSLLEASRKLRPMVATMAGAGLRNGETGGLDWTDFDPANGTPTVGESKTEAGVRQVDLPDALRKELAAYKLRTLRSSKGPMFRNRKGQRQSVSNVERRLKTVVRRANKRLDELGLRPIDEAVTPHSLRRLYASLRFALGDDPVYVANQLGHTEPGFSMKVYASAVRRRERLIGVALREFDAALDWAARGSGEPVSVDSESSAAGRQPLETAQQSFFR